MRKYKLDIALYLLELGMVESEIDIRRMAEVVRQTTK